MPKKDDQKSHKYSHFVDIEIIQKDNVAEFMLTFDDQVLGSPQPARAIARVRLDKTKIGMI